MILILTMRILLYLIIIYQVGKVSVEWLAGEKTKVVGTFPPRTRGWTGYVEKDTAGQTNIYSVEVISSFKIPPYMHVSL